MGLMFAISLSGIDVIRLPKQRKDYFHDHYIAISVFLPTQIDPGQLFFSKGEIFNQKTGSPSEVYQRNDASKGAIIAIQVTINRNLIDPNYNCRWSLTIPSFFTKRPQFPFLEGNVSSRKQGVGTQKVYNNDNICIYRSGSKCV